MVNPFGICSCQPVRESLSLSYFQTNAYNNDYYYWYYYYYVLLLLILLLLLLLLLRIIIITNIIIIHIWMWISFILFVKGTHFILLSFVYMIVKFIIYLYFISQIFIITHVNTFVRWLIFSLIFIFVLFMCLDKQTIIISARIYFDLQFNWFSLLLLSQNFVFIVWFKSFRPPKILEN